MAGNQTTTEMVEDRKHWYVMIPAECRGGKVRRRLRKVVQRTK